MEAKSGSGTSPGEACWAACLGKEEGGAQGQGRAVKPQGPTGHLPKDSVPPVTLDETQMKPPGVHNLGVPPVPGLPPAPVRSPWWVGAARSGSPKQLGLRGRSQEGGCREVRHSSMQSPSLLTLRVRCSGTLLGSQAEQGWSSAECGQCSLLGGQSHGGGQSHRATEPQRKGEMEEAAPHSLG